MHGGASGIQVRNLRKTFAGGQVVACEDVDLDIGMGELLVLLGPSGCGKTTTLRCIAGLESPDNDDAIWVRGRNMTRLAPRDRNLAFVFQDTALFPNLTVRRNISFGLDMRQEIDTRVAEAARLLKFEALLDRYPRQLSGGQGQRVGLGRAIVTEPDAFLLDEPLAALDAALRVEMRTEIKLIQRKLATTMIFVTHDQEEALTIGDKIAVMKDGRVQQVDSPQDVYRRPANLFVASFIGSPPINQFRCELREEGGVLRLAAPCFDLPVPAELARRLSAGGRELTLGLRPEFMEITGGDGSEGTGIQGVVRLTELLGSRTLVLVDAGGTEMRVLVQGEPTVGEGDRVRLAPQLARGFYFGRDGRSLLSGA
jgi:multiple sugar transport system ATP-binding protein